ncbi:MAG: twin-arginine translocation signal domain-containing protein, partial [Planctomycetota bacterium]|nr:twin-arginine translocation signal domain-containing protein [Planctomycetota bacterium]
MMITDPEFAQDVTRRHFFKECGVGVGKVALASLLMQRAAGAAGGSPVVGTNPMAPKSPHYPARAKAVIHL